MIEHLYLSVLVKVAGQPPRMFFDHAFGGDHALAVAAAKAHLLDTMGGGK